MKLLDGKEVSEAIQMQIEEELVKLEGYIPKLAVICAGRNAEKIAYEKSILRNFKSRGLEAEAFEYSENISKDEFLSEMKRINARDDVDGILFLTPLPGHLMNGRQFNLFRRKKILKWKRAENRGRCFQGDFTGFIPCTAVAVMELLAYAKVALEGKRVTIIGCSENVGIPLMSLLSKQMATVSVCHIGTKKEDLLGLCREADVVVSATGQEGLIDASYIKKGAVVIDVGISIDETGEIHGDVVFDEMKTVASAATPVPGGVGRVTRAVAARALVRAAGIRRIFSQKRDRD